MACYSDRAGGVLCRRGRAASARDATHLATQLLAAVPRADVLIREPPSVVWIKPRVVGIFPFCSLNPDADEPSAPPKFILIAPFPSQLSTPAAPR